MQVRIFQDSTNFFNIVYSVDNKRSGKTQRNLNGLCALVYGKPKFNPRINLHIQTYREYQEEKAKLWRSDLSRRTKQIETQRLKQKYLEKVLNYEEKLRQREKL